MTSQSTPSAADARLTSDVRAGLVPALRVLGHGGGWAMPPFHTECPARTGGVARKGMCCAVPGSGGGAPQFMAPTCRDFRRPSAPFHIASRACLPRIQSAFGESRPQAGPRALSRISTRRLCPTRAVCRCARPLSVADFRRGLTACAARDRLVAIWPDRVGCGISKAQQLAQCGGRHCGMVAISESGLGALVGGGFIMTMNKNHFKTGN